MAYRNIPRESSSGLIEIDESDYGPSWSGSDAAPTQGAIRDLIQNQIIPLIEEASNQDEARAVTIEKVYSETISALRWVAVLEDGRACIASSYDLDKSFVLGVAMEAGNEGDMGKILIVGQFSDSFYSTFEVNKAVFLDVDGRATQVRPETGYLVYLGIYVGSDAIKINIQSPMIL